MFEPENLPLPDEHGFFYHPDIPDVDEDQSIVPSLAAMGFDASFVGFDYDASQDLLDAYFERDDLTAVPRWTPTPPKGADSEKTVGELMARLTRKFPTT